MRVIYYGADASQKMECYPDPEEVVNVVGELLPQLQPEEWIEIERVNEP